MKRFFIALLVVLAFACLPCVLIIYNSSTDVAPDNTTEVVPDLVERLRSGEISVEGVCPYCETYCIVECSSGEILGEGNLADHQIAPFVSKSCEHNPYRTIWKDSKTGKYYLASCMPVVNGYLDPSILD